MILCTNKTYADGTSVRHTFTPDGLPLRTLFASGRWTQNAYDANRRLSSVSSSSAEDAYSLAYDAFGRVCDAEDNDALHVFARDAIGRATNELRYAGRTHSALDSALSRSYDAFGRPAALWLEFWDAFKQGVCYTWGMDGKLDGMTLSNAQGRAVEVWYSWDRGRFAALEVSDAESGDPLFARDCGRDAWRPWLVTDCFASGGVRAGERSFSYAYDRLGRPVSRSGDAFAYNARGEVTNAVLDGAAYRYSYDHIGNRTAANEDGKNTVYQSNAVNQYTNLTSNLSPLTSHLSYDLDGNLVSDGARTFEWSAAGHLAAAETSTRRYECAYDYRGRRVKRIEYRRVGNNWRWVEDRDYVYDDWNLVYEHRDHASEGEAELSYFWGPDLSGSLQGAGGVGGLVAVSIDGDFYFPGYDNNGNVIGYWDESGSLVAEYSYDAFGNTIDESGSMADVFPHRFSTKYYDSETDLYYYGYRYYSPSLGRWISRDPLEEKGGNNLFVFCQNNSIGLIDGYGQNIYLLEGTGTTSVGLLNDNHRDVCVSVWNDYFSRKCRLACFSFIATHHVRAFLPKTVWLGWYSLSPPAPAFAFVGEIKEQESPNFKNVRVIAKKTTTKWQDRAWLMIMRKTRVGLKDIYTIGNHNCRKYSLFEFNDAPGIPWWYE